MTIADRLREIVGSFSGMADFVANTLQQILPRIGVVETSKADKPILASVEAGQNVLNIGKVYDLGELDGHTIELDEDGAIEGECPQWHFFFTAGANAPQFLVDITWKPDEPTFEAGTVYEVDIFKVNGTYYGACI